MWELFEICLLNQAHFLPNWNRLAAIFSRRIPNASPDSFWKNCFYKKETIEVHTLTFYSHIILSSACVAYSYFRFHNDDYMPFLQWIPGGGRRPQLVQPTLFQGHVDLDFRSVHYCDHTGAQYSSANRM